MSEPVTFAKLAALFAYYIENTLGLPDVSKRFKPQDVQARPLVPEPSEGSEEDLEYEMIEAELPPELLEEVNSLTIWEEDLSLYVSFNSFSFEWMVYFAPTKEIGFEITGTDFQKVIEAAYQNIENRIMFACGLLTNMDIDEEWKLYCGGLENG